MRKITKIRRSIKAISPVISVLLMIAIAVAASLVAYAWVSGYMDFTTTKVGKSIQIQSVATNAVYIQNIGDSDVEIVDLYVDGTLESWSSISVEGVSTQTVGVGETATIWLNSPLPRTGNQATIKIVTSDGISAEYKETFSSISSNPTQTQYLVTVTSTANGGITPSSGYVTEGSTPVYTITPHANYQIASITANGVSVAVTNPAGQTYTFAAIYAPCTLTATFAVETVQHTVTVTQTANGVIAPGTGSVAEGSTPAYTITPDTNYHIASITANGASVTVTNPAGQTYTFASVTADCTLTATFAANTVQHTVTVTQTSNGEITPATGLVDEGSTPTYTITPDTNYQIASITANGNPVTVTNPTGQTYTFASVTIDCTLTATFETIPEPETDEIYPVAYDVTEGSLFEGDLSDMVDSDDSYFRPWVSSSPYDIDYNCDFDIDDIGVSESSITQLDITLEGYYGSDVTQTIYIYNFGTSSWDLVDTRSMGNTEETITIPITSGFTDYVDSNGIINVRINADGTSTVSHRNDVFEIAVTYTP